MFTCAATDDSSQPGWCCPRARRRISWQYPKVDAPQSFGCRQCDARPTVTFSDCAAQDQSDPL